MHVQESLPELGELLGRKWQMLALGASAFCDTWEARQGRERLFVKSAPQRGASMLLAEADGLRALAATRTIRVPKVEALIARSDGGLILVLEWLQLARQDAEFGFRFGQALAALHAHGCPHDPPAFGWPTDNFIGATPQRNAPLQEPTRSGWIAFMRTARLGAMRDRVRKTTPELAAAVDAVIDALPTLLAEGYEPRPALIHGDLWSGNWGMLGDGTPVIFDPAVSCSDPEAEIAMMELFGSAPSGFHAAYEQAGGSWPEPRRMRVYQLYHLVNHALLFGGNYTQQALRVAQGLVGRSAG
jgi:protein-ribulosamine 3-kinase